MRHSLTLAVLLGAVMPLEGESVSSRLPTFEAGVEIVHVTVSVTVGRGHHVTDLDRGAFVLFEDGVPQDLALFARDEVPVSLVLMLDSSDSMRAKLGMAQVAARAFVRTLRPGDTAEVLQFSQNVRVVQDFTSDRAALESAISGIRTDGSTALYDALYVALQDLSRQREPGALRRLAVVVLSDGCDTVSHLTDDQVLEAARRSQAAVYAVGLPTSPSPNAAASTGPQIEYFLKTLARDTGGRTYFPAQPDDLEGVYGEIAQELRTRYSLAYVPRSERQDGRWHQVTVAIPTRGDLVVHHKPGYYAPAKSRVTAR